MPSNTIPAPTEAHIENARTAVRNGAARTPTLAQEREQHAQVLAQLQAEVDWLRAIVNEGVAQ